MTPSRSRSTGRWGRITLRKLMISCFAFERSRTTSSSDPRRCPARAHRACSRSCAASESSSRSRRRRSGTAGSRTRGRRSDRGLLLGAAALEQVFDRLQRLVRDRDQEVLTDEDVELAGVEPSHRGVEDGKVKDDEQVVGVLVDLRPLVARQHVLEVEAVELEVLLEPSPLECARAIDLDPAEALAGDRLYVGLLALSGRRRLGVSSLPRLTFSALAWGGSASLLLISVSTSYIERSH